MSKPKPNFSFLSWNDRRLLLETLLWLGLARAAVLILPLRWIMRALGQKVGAVAPAADTLLQPQLERVGWAIRIVSRRTPWSSNCLAQALAGMVLLRCRRIDSTLYLGVMKADTKSLAAHAWLRSNNITITGGDRLDLYRVIGTFGV